MEHSAFPLLARLLAADALDVARADLATLETQPLAPPALRAVAMLDAVLAGVGTGALPADVDLADAVPAPTRPLVVPEGLRPLIGELGRFLHEAGHPRQAAAAFRLLGALSPESSVAGIAETGVLLSEDEADRALEVAERTAADHPGCPAAKAALAEALLFAGCASRARRAVASAVRPIGATASWLRLLRVGLDERWLTGLVDGTR